MGRTSESVRRPEVGDLGARQASLNFNLGKEILIALLQDPRSKPDHHNPCGSNNPPV